MDPAARISFSMLHDPPGSCWVLRPRQVTCCKHQNL